jgi:hypothetical protein
VPQQGRLAKAAAGRELDRFAAADRLRGGDLGIPALKPDRSPGGERVRSGVDRGRSGLECGALDLAAVFGEDLDAQVAVDDAVHEPAPNLSLWGGC